MRSTMGHDDKVKKENKKKKKKITDSKIYTKKLIN